MPFNTLGASEVSLEVYGSLVTETSAQDLPAGVSPDNQDVEYVPGSVYSRRSMRGVFAAPFPVGGPHNFRPSLTYAKSYVDKTLTIRNLYLDSNGILWVENVSESPGTYAQLFQATPGSYAKSVTAFGREYIAITDGLHGSDTPLQYDGTNLDRYTQDGPGAPPNITNLILPAVAMASGSSPGAQIISNIVTSDLTTGNGNSYFATITVTLTTAGSVTAGQAISISGNTQAGFNGTFVVSVVLSSTQFKCYFYSPASEAGTGGVANVSSGGVTMSRVNNVVTVSTVSPHQLQPGYQAQITDVPAAQVGGGIASIVIDNENNPGLATVTTNSVHGLVPNLDVTISFVNGAAVGGAITSAVRAGGITSITTHDHHGLQAGSLVSIAGVGDASFNVSTPVANIETAFTFTFPQTDTDASSSGGTVTLDWAISSGSSFTVQAAPSSTSFQIPVNYSDGTWTSGQVTYAWNGTFFVLTASPQTFTYQQYGPNANTTTVGTVTPFGQAAPGKHQFQVLFLTRQGYTTAPSPPVTFIANGGQYLSVTDIPIGPPNVVARILAFTGADGSLFYYIPVPAQENGQVVSTATQINDNTTTSILLDFSDNTLFAALAISIPGNNLANQIVIDGALAFGYSAQRLLTYGQRNTVNNFLNLGFDGGFLPSSPTIPTGWLSFPSGGGTLAAGHVGTGWLITFTPDGVERGILQQSAYLDAYGAPILSPNTSYRIRIWLQPSVADAGLTFRMAIVSVSTGFVTEVRITGTQMATGGSFVEAAFPAAMPAAIPSDLTFELEAISTSVGGTLLVDEGAVFFADTPYLDDIVFGSYVNNPEAIDGVSGQFGPADDTRKVMTHGILRNTLYLVTQEPSGRVHAVAQNQGTEPVGWDVDEVASICGALSAFCLTQSQADDSSASGGEEWMAWASASGARIFAGDEPKKISQEIQPDWGSINPAAQLRVWALNDPTDRLIYFGLPTGTASAPNLIYPLNYRELDDAYAIANSPPFHPSLSGKLIATDNTRKWTRWNLSMNGAALMYRQPGILSTTFFGGNGLAPGLAAAFGNLYTFGPIFSTDDDYGLIQSYYVPYFFMRDDAEQALQIGAQRKMLAYLSALVSGVGILTITAYGNTLSNPLRFTCNRTLQLDPDFDLEWSGASQQAQRMAFKYGSAPTDMETSLDNGFNLSRMTAAFRKSARMPVRGSAA